MMKLLYYIYYRLLCFYHEEDFAWNERIYSFYWSIQLISVLTIFLVFDRFCPLKIDANRISLIALIVCFFVWYIVQQVIFRSIGEDLKKKWKNEPPKQRRIRKYLIITYIVCIYTLFFVLLFSKIA